MTDQWYVLSEGQQLGPYSGEQLVQFAQEGRIATDTMVWADGMAEWLAASQVPGLFAAPAPVAVAAKPSWAPPGARPAAATASPYTTPLSSLVTAPVGGNYPFFTIKAASFGLWMWTVLGSILCFIGFIACIIIGASNQSAQSSSAISEVQGPPAAIMVAFSLYGLMFVLLILSYVFFLITLHRAWSCLRAGSPQTTPGKAVGMLFVPFYNLYWIFVAVAGLPKDWNRIVASYDDLHTAPRLSESVFLIFCIGSLVFAPLALIMMFPTMSQLCKGVNFFAYRRSPTSAGGLSTAGFGGVRFG